MQSTETTSMLDHALALHAGGFKCFPVIEGAKRPAVTGWQEWAASATPENIKAFWQSRPKCNVGVACGGGLAVVDLDINATKDGVAELTRLAQEAGEEVPQTREVKTPRGGRHLFFRTSAPIGNSASGIAPGVDVRGAGGFVVAAGSVVGNATYTWVDPGATIAPWPEWLPTKAARAAKSNTREPIAGIDQKAAQARAVEYLRDAPLAVEGDGGDATAFQVAARVRDFGVDEATCLELMLKDWNPGCSPPWDANELAVKVGNAYAYTKDRPGNAAPEAVFKPIDPFADVHRWDLPQVSRELERIRELSKTDPQRFSEVRGALEMFTDIDLDAMLAQPAAEIRRGLHFELFNSIEPDLTSVALVSQYLDQGAMSVVYGESNSGKTFFAMDLALHVALGRDWRGRRVQQGAVVYVAAEGGKAVRKRLAAFRKHHQLGDANAPFALVPCPVDLLNPQADTQPLIDLIGQVERQTGQKVVLVVIDTLARAIAGGNENASEDMGAFVRNVDRVRGASGAHTMVIHHSGKNKAAGARGHSSLRAATDTEIEIDERVATATKQRDLESGEPIAFNLQPVSVGMGADDELVTSCVVVARSLTVAPEHRPTLPPESDAARMLTVAQELIREEGEPAPARLKLDPGVRVIDMKRVREALKRGHLRELGDEAQKKRIQRAGDNLSRCGYIQKAKQYLWLTDEGDKGTAGDKQGTCPQNSKGTTGTQR